MNPLYSAIMNNNVEDIRNLLLSDPSSINNYNDEQTAPLVLALEQRDINPEIIQCLLDAGADVDDQDQFGRNALLMACIQGNPEVVECILNHIDEKIIFKDTTLNHYSHGGDGALGLAGFYGHVNVVKLLLQSGFDPFLRPKKSYQAMVYSSAIEIAFKNKSTVITQLFLRHNLENTKNACSTIPMLELAVENGDEAAVNFLLEFSPHQPRLLNTAATKGYFSITRMLLEKKYMPDSPCWEPSLGRSAYPIISAAKGNHFRIITTLIQHGASLNIQNEHGITALMAAVMNNSVESVEILLGAKAELNIPCRLGKTALMYLGKMDERGNKILNSLLIYGANPESLNINRDNVLTYFIRNSKTDQVKALLKIGVHPNIKNGDGEFPLLLAIRLEKLEMVKAIIENTQIRVINLRNSENHTALFMALKLHRLDIANYIIEKGADINEPVDSIDGSLLHFFIQKNDIFTSTFLLAKGADINKIDHENKFPLEYGSKKTKQELMAHWHAMKIKGYFPKKGISKESLRTIFSYTPISHVITYDSSLSRDSIFKNTQTLISLLEYFSKKCNDTDILNEKEVWCLKVILDDYDRGLISHDPLSDGIRNALWDQKPFCLMLAKADNKDTELTPDKYMELLENLIRQAATLPISDDTRKKMLEIVLPGIKTLITERAAIIYHMMHHFGQLYMLHPNLPLHTDHQNSYNEQETEALIDRILGNILGSALLCMQHGRLGEYFAKLSVGFCLEGRTREALIWTATDVLPKAAEKSFHNLMEQYLNQEYHPYSEVMHGGTLEQREYFAGTAEFITKRHGGTRCAVDPNYAPKGIVTPEGIKTYLATVMCLSQQEDQMLNNGKSIHSIAMFR